MIVFRQVMQGCVVGYVGKRARDHTTVICAIILVTLSYLVLVRKRFLTFSVLHDFLYNISDGHFNSSSALSGPNSNDNGRGSP